MASKNKKLSTAVELFEQDIGGAIRKINLQEIQPATDQPRLQKDINIDKLALSLKQEGLLQPIVVTKKGNKYIIVAGERRFRAAQSLGWKEIECRIIHKEDKDRFRLAVIENLQREDLTALEEAASYKRLKEEFSYKDLELSQIIGKSRNYINEILSIAELPQEIQDKAFLLNIQNTNLLIQLANAHKNNFANDFLESYKNGFINNVRQAKTFVQDKKQKKPFHKENTIEKNSEFQWDIQFQKDDNPSAIKIVFQKQIKEEKLKSIIEKINKLLSNSNNI